MSIGCSNFAALVKTLSPRSKGFHWNERSMNRQCLVSRAATSAPIDYTQNLTLDGGRIVMRDAAWNLLIEFTQSESLRKHALAVEACMRACSRKYGDGSPEAENLWGVV